MAENTLRWAKLATLPNTPTHNPAHLPEFIQGASQSLSANNPLNTPINSVVNLGWESHSINQIELDDYISKKITKKLTTPIEESNPIETSNKFSVLEVE